VGIVHRTINPNPNAIGAVQEPQWAESHVVDSGGIQFFDGTVQITASLFGVNVAADQDATGSQINLNWGGNTTFPVYATAAGSSIGSLGGVGGTETVPLGTIAIIQNVSGGTGRLGIITPIKVVFNLSSINCFAGPDALNDLSPIYRRLRGLGL
jgi:hypothetical protein